MVVSAYLGIAVVVMFSSGGAAHHHIEGGMAESGRPSVALGKGLWQQHGCGACHSIFGLGGHLGPDLTNVMRRRDETYLQHVIARGFGKMPSYASLTLPEREWLIAYLGYVDQLADYPLQSPWTQAFGYRSNPENPID
jgi:mono/diheme cytochrome c family protein